MKSKYNIIVLFIALMGLTSCGDYLNVMPDDIATIESAFTNRAVAERYLYTCYSYMPPIGDVDNDVAINGGVETWQYYALANTSWIFRSTYVQRGQMSVSNPNLNLWDGQNFTTTTYNLWIAIRDCNIFLQNINKPADLSISEKARWIAEVKFLKAYYHYYLMKYYGPIPIVDKNLETTASPDEVQMYREPVDDVVNYCDTLFMSAYQNLPDCQSVSNEEYGRADKQICLSVRAQMLLYAASPLYNGNKDLESLVDNKGRQLFNQTYDATKWKRAADALKEAITSCEGSGKKLYTDVADQAINSPAYFQQQTTLRQAVCKRWNSELIWGCTSTTSSDMNYMQRMSMPRFMTLGSAAQFQVCACWAPTLNTVEKFYTSHGVPMSEDKEWLQNSWYEKRYQVRPEASQQSEKYQVHLGSKTCYMHFNREPRFYAFIGFDQGEYFGAGKYSWGSTDEGDLYYTNFLGGHTAGYQGGNQYSITGYNPKKMHDFTCTESENLIGTPEYYPFPVLRLADLYLMYAEALNEFAGPSDEAYHYIDLVRARAGLEGVIDSWSKYSNNPDRPKSKSGLREIIKQERSCELCFESKYYWDIRRWKDLITVSNAQPKGWNVYGETPEDFYNVVSVAQIPVNVTTKNYFMPIREYNLSVNKNLIQNYGW